MQEEQNVFESFTFVLAFLQYKKHIHTLSTL